MTKDLTNGGDAYAFVSDGTDGYLFTTGGTGTAIMDAVKLAGAGSAGAVKFTDIAHGALACGTQGRPVRGVPPPTYPPKRRRIRAS